MNEPLMTIKNVSKQYGNHLILENINLSLYDNDFIALVGKSGGGKSTLLRLIAGFEPYSSGEIIFMNQRIISLNKQMRIMFQEDRLLPWMTVSENISFRSRGQQIKEKALSLLELVGLEDFANYYPIQLSGGQRQRVSLARALMANPKLLLLDEPLSALDALTRLNMQELIMDICSKQHLTTILVTHDVDEAARMANRIVVLKHGRKADEISAPEDKTNTEEINLIAAQIKTLILSD
ncbi:MAG: ABC transporter ATP-binding protein [Oenococcus oeni]